MFKLMRKNKKARDIIIFLVVLALASYVLFSFGQAPPQVQGDTIAKLGSTKIKLRDAMMQKQRLQSQFRKAKPDLIIDFASENLVQETLMLNGAKQHGIRVSDEELRDYIIEFRTLPEGDFLTDEQWASYIRRQYTMHVETFEEYIREKELAVNKFRTLFSSSAYVPKEKVEERFLEQNRKASLAMIEVPLSNVQFSIQVPDEELKAYYEAHPEDFSVGETRQIQYVRWSPNDYLEQVKPSDEDVEAHYNENINRYKVQEQIKASHILIKTQDKSEEEALAKIQEIKKELEGGLEFAEAAEKYSEDPSASKGGDLGFFGKGRMVPAFEEVAFTLEKGVISEPVLTKFGYHLIQVNERTEARTRPLEEVRPAIINEIKRRDAREVAKADAEAFASSLSDEVSLEQAAEEAGLEVQTSSHFDNDNLAQIDATLRGNSQVLRAAFDLEEVGGTSDAIDTGTAIVVFKLADIQESGTIDFTDENKARIRRMVQEAKAREKIEGAFAEIRAEVENDGEKKLEDFKGKYDFLKENHFIEAADFTAVSMPRQLNRVETDFMDDIYSHEVGSFLDLEPANKTRLILARLTDKAEPDMSQLDEKFAEIAEQIRSQQGSDLLSAFLFASQQKLDPKQEALQKIKVALASKNR